MPLTALQQECLKLMGIAWWLPAQADAGHSVSASASPGNTAAARPASPGVPASAAGTSPAKESLQVAQPGNAVAPRPVSPGVPASATATGVPVSPAVVPASAPPGNTAAPRPASPGVPASAAGTSPAKESPQAALDAIREQVASCTACALHQGRRQTVFARGNENAEWMVVGEAPGAEEDRQGKPFVGRAGKLLDSMLAAISLGSNDVYIANIIKCRPPENRNPEPDEVSACMGWLNKQVELVQPRIILAVGRFAAQSLLRSNSPVRDLRGKRHVLPGSAIPVVVSYHPAYLLRSPGNKAQAWKDLLLAKKVYSGELNT